jgi:A/G-specific adenine glycosylase
VLCPWRAACTAAAHGIAEGLPVPIDKPERPLRYGIAFWITRSDGAVLLRRRPEKGLLGGMVEIPSTPWRVAPWTLAEAAATAPTAAQWSALPGTVRHGFTHFQLELGVVAGVGQEGTDGLWSPIDKLGEHALPTLMKKVARHAISALARGTHARASNNGSSPASASRTGANERR